MLNISIWCCLLSRLTARYPLAEGRGICSRMEPGFTLLPLRWWRPRLWILVASWSPGCKQPDFSPIENLLAMIISMAEKLGRMQPCATFEKLWGAWHAARAEITPANLHNLFESLPRRLAVCIEKDGATLSC